MLKAISQIGTGTFHPGRHHYKSNDLTLHIAEIVQMFERFNEGVDTFVFIFVATGCTYKKCIIVQTVTEQSFGHLPKRLTRFHPFFFKKLSCRHKIIFKSIGSNHVWFFIQKLLTFYSSNIAYRCKTINCMRCNLFSRML
ncbi:hypothetical protein SDC9_169797 [bioreactor metagenome]|uniref:Uncharacterized protein n=1 Tax=bioreactor metagenome TaxID=1076179 RepID=A0A645GEJ0_9ZZZZ